MRGAVSSVLLLMLVGGCAPGPREGPRPNPAAGESPDPAALMLAAAFAGNTPLVREALDQGVEPGTTDGGGRTALMLASFNGHSETVVFLLRHGVDVNARDRHGLSPLMYASTGPYDATVRILLEHGADPLASEHDEHSTALMIAAFEGHADVVRTLLQHGSDPSMVNTHGDTALDLAAKNEHVEAVALLKEAATGMRQAKRAE